jgi:nucleoside-diphosphate-sugar epimerase
VIPAILEQLHRGDQVEVGNMDVRRDFVHVEDVADVMHALVAEIRPGLVVNVGTGRSHSVREILATIQEILERPLEIRQDPERMRASDRPDLRSDISLLRRCLPSLPPRDLHAGLSALLESEGLVGS